MPKRARNKRPATQPSSVKRGSTGWGGRRAGAGRPRGRARRHASEPHKRRPSITGSHPIHITARFISPGLGVEIDAALARALRLSHERGDFRILDVRVRRDAIHLVVEAADKLALARGMQGFQVSAARGINRIAKRRGGVFADRYRALRAPGRARIARG